MLIEFRVANFRSFREEQAFSLVAGNGDELPSNCIDSDDYHLLRCAAIYGPNASGKSNFVEALNFVTILIGRSADLEAEVRFNCSPFLLDQKSRTKPSTFEITFILDGVRYQYGFSISPKRIQDEWLIAYPKGRAQQWFTREFDKEQGEHVWSWSRHFKGQKDRLSQLTRPGALFLSVAARFNHAQLLPVYEYLARNIRVLTTRDLLFHVTAQYLEALRPKDESDDEYKKTVLGFLQKADLGITDVLVESRELPEAPDPMGKLISSLPEPDRRQLMAAVKQQLEARFGYDIRMLHRNPEDDKEIPIPFEEESAGTQRFFKLIGPWIEALLFGYTVVIDELESSLHPLLTRELVKFFQSGGKSQAQLVFTTHDTTLLDPELLRRDQVWFTEKAETGATRLYSLYDYREHKARKGEAMQKGYLAGRYGAIPIIEAFEQTESNGQ